MDSSRAVASPSSAAQFRTVLLPKAQLSDHFLGQWCFLMHRAESPNGYLSPQFVLPALEHLDKDKEILFFAVYDEDDSLGSLVGLGIFEFQKASLARPFGLLRTYLSEHSYLSGILADKRHLSDVAAAMCETLLQGPCSDRWSAIEFPQCRAGTSDFLSLLAAAREAGIGVLSRGIESRAVLLPGTATSDRISSHIGPRRLKEFRRIRRRLAEIGSSTWRLVEAGPELSGAIERFIELENNGWRGKAGSSLMSSARSLSFFRQMAASFAESNSIFIAELLVDNRVVASTFNFLAGDLGFAFKIGWDPAFAKFGIGMLNELAMLEAAPTRLAHLSNVDSGADSGSFIEALWPDRDEVGTFVFSLSLGANAYYRAKTGLKRLMRRRISGRR